MTKVIQKIDKQITSLLGKIDSLSGNYRTNTWKRQREQQDRDRKKEIYRSQIQVLEYLKQKAQTFGRGKTTHILMENGNRQILLKHSITESEIKFEMTGTPTVILVADKAA